MTNEEKQLLLVNLCARLPYEVKLKVGNDALSIDMFRFDNGFYSTIEKVIKAGHKMYLRPMSSMTEDEMVEYIRLQLQDEFADVRRQHHCCNNSIDSIVDKQHVRYWYNEIGNINVLDWLNAHHFDYRGLIEKGLALEAPGGMYS